MQKNEFGPLSHTIYDDLWKMEKSLNVRAKLIKLLEENVEVNLQDLGFDNGFLERTPNAGAMKEKKTLKSSKLKKVCAFKDAI